MGTAQVVEIFSVKSKTTIKLGVNFPHYSKLSILSLKVSGIISPKHSSQIKITPEFPFLVRIFPFFFITDYFHNVIQLSNLCLARPSKNQQGGEFPISMTAAAPISSWSSLVNTRARFLLIQTNNTESIPRKQNGPLRLTSRKIFPTLMPSSEC